MNNTLRIILKVLTVITWVLMMGWYISLLLTLVQALRMYGNMPIGEVPYLSLPMFDICFVQS